MTRKKLGAAILAAAVASSGACAARPDTTTETIMEYLENVRRLEAEGAALEAGSDSESAAIERFQTLLADFKAPDFRRRIKDVYADDVFFNDTLKTISGSTDLEEYLGASADALETGTVEFLDLVTSEGNYYFRWHMTLRFKSLARGRDTTTVGMSHVRFDDQGKVVLHQDFWDSTTGLFEHIPAIGWMIRGVKRRL